MTRRAGAADLALDAAAPMGKRVIEARGIAKSYGDRMILRDFSIRITRGERVALVGPNGAGKTTLLKMLIGETGPDEGSVSLGANVEMAVFDQNRAALDPEMSLWETLTGDPDMRVGGRADQVMVRGTPRHVVGYLKDFLFDESRARAPVRSLSGGERARLLLAKLFARQSNLIVLDEPTNDLDLETLDLLQEVIADYDGTVLMVSHDRDFIDRTATATVAMEGDGRATLYAGGWSDYRAQRGERPERGDRSERGERPERGERAEPAEGRAVAAGETDRANGRAASPPVRGLSFTERHRLDALPGEIERMEAEIAKLAEYLAAPDLYAAHPVKFARASEVLAGRQAALAAAEEEWLALEERAG